MRGETPTHSSLGAHVSNRTVHGQRSPTALEFAVDATKLNLLEREAGGKTVVRCQFTLKRRPVLGIGDLDVCDAVSIFRLGVRGASLEDD